jgi:hypothetical protein
MHSPGRCGAGAFSFGAMSSRGRHGARRFISQGRWCGSREIAGAWADWRAYGKAAKAFASSNSSKSAALPPPEPEPEPSAAPTPAKPEAVRSP